MFDVKASRTEAGRRNEMAGKKGWGRARADCASKKAELRIRIRLGYPWIMAPTITMTKPLATAMATFVSTDKFIIFPFNYGCKPLPLFFGFCISYIASNFGILMDARQSKNERRWKKE